MTTMHRDDLPVLKELLSQTVDPIEVISVSFSLRAVKVNMAITIYCTFYTSTLFCLDCRLTLDLPRRMDGTVDVNRGLLSPLITLHISEIAWENILEHICSWLWIVGKSSKQTLT